jgi:DNA gyrase subunit A
MVVPTEEAPDVLTICNNGYGKRTHMDEYRKQGRSGSGIISLKISERTGVVSGVIGVSEKDDIMVITSAGVMIRTSVDQISQLGRSTQGVRIINIDEGGNVASIARIVEPEEDIPEGGEQAQGETVTETPEIAEDTVAEPEES